MPNTAIRSLPKQGLLVDMQVFDEVRLNSGDGTVWNDKDNRDNMLFGKDSDLGNFFARYVENRDGFALFELKRDGREFASKSEPINPSKGIPEDLKDELEAAFRVFHDRLKDPKATEEAKEFIESLKMADPKMNPDMYRLYKDGNRDKLLVIWGCNRKGSQPLLPLDAIQRLPTYRRTSPLLKVLGLLLALAALAIAAVAVLYMMDNGSGTKIAIKKDPEPVIPVPPKDPEKTETPDKPEPGPIGSVEDERNKAIDGGGTGGGGTGGGTGGGGTGGGGTGGGGTGGDTGGGGTGGGGTGENGTGEGGTGGTKDGDAGSSELGGDAPNTNTTEPPFLFVSPQAIISGDQIQIVPRTVGKLSMYGWRGERYLNRKASGVDDAESLTFYLAGMRVMAFEPNDKKFKEERISFVVFDKPEIKQLNVGIILPPGLECQDSKIDWGDGTSDTITDVKLKKLTHDYQKSGSYKIRFLPSSNIAWAAVEFSVAVK